MSSFNDANRSCHPPDTTIQSGAVEEEDDSEDYPPAWVAEQKRLRDALDWEKPYVRDKPRNWDYITGLPVPRRIKIEEVRALREWGRWWWWWWCGGGGGGGGGGSRGGVCWFFLGGGVLRWSWWWGGGGGGTGHRATPHNFSLIGPNQCSPHVRTY